jgi:threonylcarbamoyladenosine tRNA methylthiotransferase MtaB
VRDHAGNAGLNNAIIFNTCAVTAEAERQARQAIRRARRDNPDAQIVVTGCAAQIAPDSWSSMAEVDHVIGNHDKLSQAAWMSVAEGCEAIIVSDVMAVREMATHMMDGFHAHTRGFLQIQQGCDHRCTFCIIPYGRGNNRSAGLTQIIDAAQQLVDGGSVEVVLTGVDITSWGSDLPGRPRLGDLVQALLSRVSGLQRLRLSSIDPAEPDARLMAVLGDDDRLMPHLHLSAQHGDDLVLKQMKRRHLARDVIRFCDEARRRRPDIVFGADIIAGFPTETEDAHNATRQMIHRAGITYLHVFPFSPRTGTPAARMRQIDGDTIRRRARELREDGTIRMQQFLDNAVGSLDQMLVEGGNSGHGRNYAKMRLQGDFIDRGALLDVKINGRDDDILIVEQIG